MDTESTVEDQPIAETSQPADSLTEELAAQFDLIENEDVETENASEDAPAEAKESTDAEDEPLQPPENWSSGDKEAFLATDRTGQEFLLRRHDELEKAFYKKTEDLADVRKTHEAWEPVREMFKAVPGINPVQTVQSWAQIAQALDKNPQETLNHLAQQYGVSLKQENDEFIDPKVSSLEQKLAKQDKIIQELQSGVLRDAETRKQAENNRLVNTIKEFAESKTEAGDLAHPYFDELYPDMMRLAKADHAEGRQPNLEQLYEDARRINRDISAKIEADQQKASAKKAEAEAIARAKKAKHAAKSNPNSSGGVSSGGDLDLRDELAQYF